MRRRSKDQANEIEKNNLTDLLENPVILKCPVSSPLQGAESVSYPDILSVNLIPPDLSICSDSYKRKISVCENEDLEQNFVKIKKKCDIISATSWADVAIDNEDDCVKSNLYEPKKLTETESDGMTLNSSNDSALDLSIQKPSITYLPELTWKEEKHYLMRVSLAKIYDVDDAKTYLRRSVLINNSVRRLQKDFTIDDFTSFFQDDNLSHSFNSGDIETSSDEGTKEKDYMMEQKDLCHNNTIFCHSQPFSSKLDGSLLNKFQNSYKVSQSLSEVNCDSILSDKTFKPADTHHALSSETFGLQNGTSADDYDNNESSYSSSILDSVVYHSIIASLET